MCRLWLLWQVSDKTVHLKNHGVETKKSPVWEYFVPGDNSATCQLCQRIVKRSGGNTSNLIAHLRCVHRAHYEVMVEEDGRQKMETEQQTPVCIALFDSVYPVDGAGRMGHCVFRLFIPLSACVPGWKHSLALRQLLASVCCLVSSCSLVLALQSQHKGTSAPLPSGVRLWMKKGCGQAIG